jgi:type VI secretion system secreted protein Hcp
MGAAVRRATYFVPGHAACTRLAPPLRRPPSRRLGTSVVENMAQHKKTQRATKKRPNRWALAGMLALIVIGAAVSGSAIGKRESSQDASTGASTAAVDTFMPPAHADHAKVTYVIGFETADGASMGNFEIKDFSFGVENPTTIGSATGGASTGRAQFQEFTITKTSDKASPAFFKNCVTGAHYKTVTLSMRKAGGDPTSAGKPFLSFKFGTVFTTKIDWSGPGDEGPEESITFVYGSLQVAYNAQDPGNSTSFEWNPVDNS